MPTGNPIEFHPIQPTKLNYTSIQQGILDLCKTVIFRQSMISTYMQCPQMAMYDSILKLEESAPFMAAVMGTAGHKVIFDATEQRKFGLTYEDVNLRFSQAFREAISQASKMPQMGEKFATIDEAANALMPEYVRMVLGYLQHKRHKDFHSTIHEQLFVLPILAPELSPRPFLFTGQIDQVGVNDQGQLHLNDFKFRMNAYKPGFADLNLNVQFTIYAYALRHGFPSCNACRPRYNPEDLTVIYDGPCSVCNAKIGTKFWPQKYPQVCNMVWMRDFIRREEDEFTKMIPDPKKLKVRNPETGRLKIRKVINPKWASGGRVGDYDGKGWHATARPPAALNVLMSDVLRTANSIRNAVFYRNPEKSRCNQWCRHKERCQNQVEMEMELSHVSQIEQGILLVNPFEET
jgi:RecB family exonuclease